MAAEVAVIDARIERITRYPFRAKFHLRPQELDYLASRGLDIVRRHAREVIDYIVEVVCRWIRHGPDESIY